ncbi:MAG TPA: glycosyl hydrolase [Mycobacteriales bacterium]
MAVGTRVAALLACVVLAACTGGPDRGARPDTPVTVSTAVPPRTGPVTTTGRGPAAPASGAWLGAWVNSGDHTARGRVAAFTGFERTVGRSLTIAHVFHPWDDAFPTGADLEFVHRGKLLLLSWSGTDTRAITSGRYDDLIRRRAQAVRDLGVPLLLRFRWEMDRPNLRSTVHSPEDYIAAWRHVRWVFTDAGATNAAWVWCPLVTGFAEGLAQRFYPGDDQVDWLCADVYAGRDFRGFDELMAPFLAWARQHPRPVLVGEFGATEGDPGRKARWFRAVAPYVAAYPQVKALVYFSARQDRYDFSVDSSPGALRAFRELAGDPRLRAAPP